MLCVHEIKGGEVRKYEKGVKCDVTVSYIDRFTVHTRYFTYFKRSFNKFFNSSFFTPT